MTIGPFLDKVVEFIINPILLLMFALSFLYLVYGIFNFLRQDMNAVDKTRSESRSAIMWGIVGMVIMFSVFGLIQVVLGTFGLTKSDINSTDSEKILNL